MGLISEYVGGGGGGAGAHEKSPAHVQIGGRGGGRFTLRTATAAKALKGARPSVAEAPVRSHARGKAKSPIRNCCYSAHTATRIAVGEFRTLSRPVPPSLCRPRRLFLSDFD